MSKTSVSNNEKQHGVVENGYQKNRLSSSFTVTKSRVINETEDDHEEDDDSRKLNVKENKQNLIENGLNGDSGTKRILNENDLRDLLFAQKRLVKQSHNNDPHLNQIIPTNGTYIYEEWDQIYSFPRLFLSNNLNEYHSPDPFVLQPSLFHINHVPPTVYFNTKLDDNSRPPIGLPNYLSELFKWKISNITPNSIRNCVSFMKFKTIKPSNELDSCYLGSWYKHMLTAEFCHLEEWKKVNHIPGSFHLGRKDKLWFKLKTAIAKFGPEEFGNFQPTTFILPKDYDELCEFWENSPSKLFIIKPPASARGNGIRVINDIKQIPPEALLQSQDDRNLLQNGDKTIQQQPLKKSTMIVQQYIHNPCLLENGQKFDLRVYVLLTSVDPLRIYVYDEGLVRFASSKYTCQEDGIIDQYMHLTNYFINKNNQEYQINNDCESLQGCKWTLKRFWRYLKDHYVHIDAQLLWDNIIDIIIKTIICCEGPMTRLSRLNCKNDYTSYELFGFDIILDENFKPWILEVNITPSLKTESDLDTSVKYGVIRDMFNLVGYNLPPVTSEVGKLDVDLADCRLCFDSKLYTECLIKRDKVKQLKYQKLHKNDNNDHQQDMQSQHDRNKHDIHDIAPTANSQNNLVPKILDSDEHSSDVSSFRTDKHRADATYKSNSCDNILNDLTQNDLRVLMLSEDELSRCGRFKRVFPSATSNKYLRYFDKVRYYNLLLDAWEKKYQDNRLEGIKRLSAQANFME